MQLGGKRRISARTATKLPSGTVIAAESLEGSVTQTIPSASATQSNTADSELPVSLTEALNSLEIYSQETIELNVAPIGTDARNGDLVVIQPAPALYRDAVQIILYVDESGGLSWHLPDQLQQRSTHFGNGFFLRSAVRRRSGEVSGATFTIPARTHAANVSITAQSECAPNQRRGLRGVATKVGRKILKVLVIPLLGRALATPLKAIVESVEARVQQERVRLITPENYRENVAESFTDWHALDGRRALLVIHGIFSNTHGVLRNLPRSAMDEFFHHYAGRIIGLDQLTVSRSPEENAQFFLRQAYAAKPGSHFEFDILCHSRGGIVARALAERSQDLVPKTSCTCTFRKVFFVATPNRGSVLANASHTVEMIDLFTNVATALPDGAVAYSIETLLAILKLVVYAAETSLPGLAAMGTNGYITGTLNRGGIGTAAYAAASSNFAPTPEDNGFIIGRFGSAAIDRIFRDGEAAVANDLVVPSEGVFGSNGHAAFPIQNPLLFRETDRVWHGGFFERSETIDAIRRHFGLPKRETIEISVR